MVDPRIPKYRAAALAMKHRQFAVEVPTGTPDEVGQLGQALVDLGKEMEQQFAQLQALSRVTERINAGLILDEVLNLVFETFRPLIPYDRIGFSLLEEDGQVVRARWARSDAPIMQIGRGYSAAMQGSSLQRIIETRQPRILNNLLDYLRQHPDSDSTHRIIEEGMRSSLTCPLIALGKPIGFMFFSSTKPDTYAGQHVELFQQIAGQLAAIVEKSRLYQQLIELNQLKNRFLGIAAHDLRNPIGVVKGYLELFLDGDLGEIANEQREFVDLMDQACDRMLALINDLLDYNAIEAGRLDLRVRPLALEGYLRECFRSNEVLARAKSIRLDLDLPAGLPTISMDPDRIAQVINNLITNAIKFSYPETTITLRARATDNAVEIGVKDQGQGIPAEELPKVFTEFGKTSTRPTAGEKSTGLGLAIVKRIVEAHCGSIRVESQVGAGSTFTFTLPMGGNA
ncbi:MAG: GAF domain-containing sensor histidine kinase [Chloroflexi bacterium]|nr:GAF domain-containing sensor histidine kinase [Chloroflexota bacterium]